jgi:hypothetical protein
MTEPCRLCGAETENYLTLPVLGQYDVRYYHCKECDLLQTETPYWLDKAYSSTISALDTGAISRNVFCTRLTILVGRLLRVARTLPCLDYGGGHGVFTRMMRDGGRNFKWCDKYGPNLFARGFEGDPKTPHAFVTAFEVFEHLVNVRDELGSLFGPGHNFVLVGTVLHANQDEKWWYFVPESGQHVAFYSRRTMQHIGDRFGYDVICGPAYSLFIKRVTATSGWRRALIKRILCWPWLAYGLGTLLLEMRLTRSLTWADHLQLKAAVTKDKPA